MKRWLGFVLVLLCLGAGSAIDWSSDARWELLGPQSGHAYRLGQSFSELNQPLPPPTAGAFAWAPLGPRGEAPVFARVAQENDMAVVEEGLLLRHRNDEIINLTTLKPGWKLTCNGRLVGTTGARLDAWEAELGPPLQHWVNPKKVGVIHFYRAALAEIGLLVANGEVPSVMLVEPGTLAGALERTGYGPLEP